MAIIDLNLFMQTVSSCITFEIGLAFVISLIPALVCVPWK